MILKWYEVSCDQCGTCLNHYIGCKPSIKELKNDGFITYKEYVFCTEECYNKFRDIKPIKNLILK